MQIGIFIENNWLPAILSSNPQGFIIKYDTKSIIVNFKEIINCRINEQGLIELFYITMKNAQTVKTRININSDDIEKTFNMLTTAPTIEEPAANENRFTVVQKEELKNTEEFIQKQNMLNKNKIEPAKKIPLIFSIIIAIVLVLIGTIFIKSYSINSVNTLTTSFWSNETSETDYFTFEFLDKEECKYSHFATDGKSIDECKYKLDGKKVTINYENGEEEVYKWNINYTVKDFKIRISLKLNEDIYYSKED